VKVVAGNVVALLDHLYKVRKDISLLRDQDFKIYANSFLQYRTTGRIVHTPGSHVSRIHVYNVYMPEEFIRSLVPLLFSRTLCFTLRGGVG